MEIMAGGRRDTTGGEGAKGLCVGESHNPIRGSLMEDQGARTTTYACAF